MAHNNTEIELKTKLTKNKFESVKKELHKRTKFIKESHHIDDYYTPKRSSFLRKKHPYEWLTVRKRDGVITFNYKHWYPENTKYTTHCDEYETVVSDDKKLTKILTALNFKKFITLNKKRFVFSYKKELEIALDIVVGLGYYIEIETTKDFGSVDAARERIFEFARTLGLTQTRTVPGGYVFQILKKKGLL